MFWGFPQRLRLQCWLIENPPPGAQKGGAGGYFPALKAPRAPIFWVRTHFASQLRRNSVLTPTRIFLRVKDQFLAVLRPFLGSQSLIFTQSVKREAIETVKTFSEENFVGCINSLNAILKVQHGVKTFLVWEKVLRTLNLLSATRWKVCLIMSFNLEISLDDWALELNS